MIGPHKKPNKAEQARMDALSKMQCPCCLMVLIHYHKVEIHHIVSGNKRLGHWYTIPLCAGHHRGEFTDTQVMRMSAHDLVAISDGRYAFQTVYGTEKAIWLKIQEVNGWDSTWPGSKVLPRRTA